MRIVRHLERVSLGLRSPIVTLGNFDGVHVGHREILDRVVREARARGGDAVVVTFFPHPAAVLAPERAPSPIGSLHERLACLRELDVDLVVAQHFTRPFSRLSADDFIERMLVGRLGAVKVIIGHSVNFGRDRTGNVETLREAGARHGFEVEVVAAVRVDGVAVSSSEVRRTLATGDVARAARLLGRCYAVDGHVVVGDRRGRTIGFPTANVATRVPVLIPDGVYAVRAEGDRLGAVRDGVANVGRNPTFGGGRGRSVEAHLFDFDGDLYGKRLRVSFVERLRGEIRFPSVDALVAQIARDAADARRILAG